MRAEDWQTLISLSANDNDVGTAVPPPIT
jgi:hypothetical protein